MARPQGHHFKRNEVKSYIIEFILGSKGLVKEADIRRILKEKYDLSDQGTINKHLHNLQTLGCVDKFPPVKKGLANKWDITELKHLKNIKHNFSEIKLNMYEKSLFITLHESGCNITSFGGFNFYIRLFLSASFLNLCIETGIESLSSRAWEIYLLDKGFKKDQQIRRLLDNCYITYIKDNPSFEFSKEDFLEIIYEIVQEKDEVSKEAVLKMCNETISRFFENTSGETISKTEDEMFKWMNYTFLKVFLKDAYHKKFEEKFPGWSKEKEITIELFLKVSQKIPNIRRNTSRFTFIENLFKTTYEDEFTGWLKEKEMLLERFQKEVEENREMYTKIDEIISLLLDQKMIFEISRLDLLLEHSLYNDILIGIASPEEIEFAKKMKENYEEINSLFFEPNDFADVIKSWVLYDLKQISETIVKCKPPLSFFNLCNSAGNTYHTLIEFFGYDHLFE